ncbi:Cysteine synthase [Salix suchowensis]|nr:Cysteine synthase [Salix suchowensis]
MNSVIRQVAFRRNFSSKSIVNGFTGAVGNTPLVCRHILCALYNASVLRMRSDIFKRPVGKDWRPHIWSALFARSLNATPMSSPESREDRLAEDAGCGRAPRPAVAYENPANYNHQARDYAKDLPNAIWTDQFDNTANANAHYTSTGPEIWEQTQGELDGFICATGIGQGRITNNLGTFINDVSGAFTVSDDKSIRMLYELLDSEGLYMGASSALNVVAAVELGLKLGKGSKVATILCDGAYRYQSRLFSRQWLESKELLNAIPSELQKYIVLD